MPVTLFMNRNKHGNGRIVGVAIMKDEKRPTLHDAISSFAECYECLTSDIRSVFVDKSMNEIARIWEVLPHVEVHLCRFDVIEIFKRETKLEPNKVEVKQLCQKMCYSETEEEYNELEARMMKICSDSFKQYFVKNWQNCRAIWKGHDRLAGVTFGLSTTNSNESIHGKFKALLSRKVSISACFRKIRMFHENYNVQAAYKDFLSKKKVHYVGNSKDTVVSEICDACTPFVASLLKEQLEWSYKMEALPAGASADCEKCTCGFYRSRKFPCCHMFFSRKLQNKTLFSSADVPSKWRRIPEGDEDSDVDGDVLSVDAVPPPLVVVPPCPVKVGGKPLTRNQKYSKFIGLCAQAGNLAAICGGQQFLQRCSVIEDLINNWENNVEVAITPLASVNTSSGNKSKGTSQTTKISRAPKKSSKPWTTPKHAPLVNDRSTRREKGLSIPDSNVSSVSRFKWEVAAQSSTGSSYLVTKELESSNTCLCTHDEHCVHCFNCTCKDFQFRKAPCKHIYKVQHMYVCSLDDEPADSPDTEVVGSTVHSKDATLPDDPHLDLDTMLKDDIMDSTALALIDAAEREATLVTTDNSASSISVTNQDLVANQDNISSSLDVYKCFGCDELRIRRVSRQPKSFGREFFACPQPIKSRCKKFFWAPTREAILVESPATSNNKIDSYFSKGNVAAIIDLTNESDEEVVCNRLSPIKEEPKEDGCGSQGAEASSPILCRKRKALPLRLMNTKKKCTGGRGDPPLHIRQAVLSLDMWPDSVIGCALELLKEQFPQVMGFSLPIPEERVLTRWPLPGEEHTSYPPCNKNSYIQIINTGHSHWITCFKTKGSENIIYVLNSSGALDVGSFVEQQLALIINTKQEEFTLAYQEVQQQAPNTNDCGPLAVAFATELAFQEKVTYVEFKAAELRQHLLRCLVARRMEPFPRVSERPSKRLKFELVDVGCTCRLPGHYDQQMIKCSKCRLWCHYRCQGLSDKPSSRRWHCKNCSKN